MEKELKIKNQRNNSNPNIDPKQKEGLKKLECAIISAKSTLPNPSINTKQKPSALNPPVSNSPKPKQVPTYTDSKPSDTKQTETNELSYDEKLRRQNEIDRQIAEEKEHLKRIARGEKEKKSDVNEQIAKDKERIKEIANQSNQSKKEPVYDWFPKRKESKSTWFEVSESFSSLGFASGEIAPLGLMYECGGNHFMGFHIAVRTSWIDVRYPKNATTYNGQPNKTEIDLGPNFKISKRFFINLGVGYGLYKYTIQNNYNQTSSEEFGKYIVTSAGLTIRLFNRFNINGGASFMDIHKDIYKPEIIFGITYNLKN
jgi:hypothetical protein